MGKDGEEAGVGMERSGSGGRDVMVEMDSQSQYVPSSWGG